jgi:hypothetical protein
MKHIATMALMLNLGVASVYAHQKSVNVKMKFSGTGGPSSINLQHAGTGTAEENYAGNGALGSFTFRNVEAETTSPQFSRTCSGPAQLYLTTVAGAGVLRFQDGSLIDRQADRGSVCLRKGRERGDRQVTFAAGIRILR